ncbi:MAG: hypothetical protein SWE60_01535 [Thermodesulfobacteriota bacterium]|nr:hypothetical protein [Thermodesulfobacteriota bacterium]
MRSLRFFGVLGGMLSLIAIVGGTSPLMASSGASHATHFFSDKGPLFTPDETGCSLCHAGGDRQCEESPVFADDEYLTDTTVCDACHSQGGMVDGVAMAKANWEDGVYEPGGSPLQAGKESWCISCHDAGTSVCDGVSAPDISGDNTTYGYYVNGHRSRLCSDCHDLTMGHIDGEARTYAFNMADYGPGESGVSYALGYRLKSMGVDDPGTDYDESVPLMVPTNFGTTFSYVGQDIRDNAFRLCFSCHDKDEVLDDTPGDGLDTNFKAALPDPPLAYSYSSGDSNQHVLHVIGQTMQAWDSDWDLGTTGPGPGPGYDTLMTCSACHNVHGAARAEGSTNEPMIRDGSLAGRTGYGFSYVVKDSNYPQVTSAGASLPNSVGAVFRNGNALCSTMCHLSPTPPGTSYDATGSGSGTYLEYYRALEEATCDTCHAYGTEASHPTHGDSTGKGVDIGCYDCHASGHVNEAVDFVGGDFATTNACNACHSTGGAFGGVTMAKDNWADGIYEAGGVTFQPGKEQWCAGCHDDEGANSKQDGTGITAPNIMGDSAQETYGYMVSGHGQSSAGLKCDVCHDVTRPHIDGNPRTYEADESFWLIDDGRLAVINGYDEGYRLNPGLVVPTPPGGSPEKAALCVNCHMSVMGTATNFMYDRQSTKNLHVAHMNVTDCWAWDSDGDGTGGSACQDGDSGATCTTCHNVHGSPMDVGGTFYPNPVMVRHGELTDTEPGLHFRWYTDGQGGQYGGEVTPDLMASLSGALWCMPPTCANIPCHSNSPYYNRTPTDFFGRGIVIDDFDSYANDTGLQGNWTNTEDAKDPRLEPDAGGLLTGGPDGSQCMRARIAWTETASAYGTSARSYDPYIDLRAANSMSFYVYVKNTAKIERVVVRLKKYPDETYCEATVLTSSLQDEVWEPVSFLRADFNDDSWGKVSEIQFQIHEYDPEQAYAVNVYFDDIRFKP